MYSYENLANAIILQAVKDYRVALKALARKPDAVLPAFNKKEIEKFFSSSWFNSLTDLDPQMLVERLNAEVEA